jgi:hypothetical protein
MTQGIVDEIDRVDLHAGVVVEEFVEFAVSERS